MKKLMPRIIGTWLTILNVISAARAGKAAFLLFSRPRRAPAKNYQNKFYESAVLATFDAGGVQIQTYRWGSGARKILLLHGWESHSFRWKKYIDEGLSRGCTLYALDAPAHGRSGGDITSLPQYSSVITQYVNSIGPLHAIVAHSFGGFAALYAIYVSPSLSAGRLILMGVPGESADFIESMRVLLGMSRSTAAAMTAYFTKVIGHSPEYFSAARFAAGLKLPVLIIHNDPDEEAPYKYAQRLNKIIPHSVLITTHGIGHNLKSRDVVRQVFDFACDAQTIESEAGNE